jgi:hypothetical protein
VSSSVVPPVWPPNTAAKVLRNASLDLICLIPDNVALCFEATNYRVKLAFSPGADPECSHVSRPDLITTSRARRRMAGLNFQSFFMAGFECSSQRRLDGARLDLIESTRHDRFVDRDYERARRHGLRTCRDGVRWHAIETRPGQYDWSSFLPMLRAAERHGIQVIWDLCHYGYPDDIDIWSPDFTSRFAAFAAAAARLIRDETGEIPLLCPVNEMSFWAWAGGHVGQFQPCTRDRGGELKRQLVRAWIAAAKAIRESAGEARLICAEPAIHVDVGSCPDADHIAGARAHHEAQFEATDLLTGRLEPELGGRPDYLDVVGVNFYPDNQWYHGGATIPLGHHGFRPFSEMLAEWAGRYDKPLIVSETGAEGSGRAAWLHYVCDETRAARSCGVPVEGLCIYPILEYAGWANDRVCATGLLSQADSAGERRVYEPLAEELRRQQQMMASQGRDRRTWADALAPAAE